MDALRAYRKIVSMLLQIEVRLKRSLFFVLLNNKRFSWFQIISFFLKSSEISSRSHFFYEHCRKFPCDCLKLYQIPQMESYFYMDHAWAKEDLRYSVANQIWYLNQKSMQKVRFLRKREWIFCREFDKRA